MTLVRKNHVPATIPAFSSAVPLKNTLLRRRPALCSRACATRASTAAAPPVRFPGLRAARFQHPVDVRATRTLRAVPALEPAIRAVLGAAESAMILDGLASGVKVSETQLPSLHKIVESACAVLDMPAPELYVKQNPVPNAYTLAFQGRRPFIVVHSSLLELLDEKEIAAVIGHECGHLKSEHGMCLIALHISFKLAINTQTKLTLTFEPPVHLNCPSLRFVAVHGQSSRPPGEYRLWESRARPSSRRARKRVNFEMAARGRVDLRPGRAARCAGSARGGECADEARRREPELRFRA